MNNLRLFCATVTLICALAFSAYAGEIECGGVVNPPPPPTGQMNTPLTQAALIVIADLFSLS